MTAQWNTRRLVVLGACAVGAASLAAGTLWLSTRGVPLTGQVTPQSIVQELITHYPYPNQLRVTATHANVTELGKKQTVEIKAYNLHTAPLERLDLVFEFNQSWQSNNVAFNVGPEFNCSMSPRGSSSPLQWFCRVVGGIPPGESRTLSYSMTMPLQCSNVDAGNLGAFRYFSEYPGQPYSVITLTNISAYPWCNGIVPPLGSLTLSDDPHASCLKNPNIDFVTGNGGGHTELETAWDLGTVTGVQYLHDRKWPPSEFFMFKTASSGPLTVTVQNRTATGVGRIYRVKVFDISTGAKELLGQSDYNMANGRNEFQFDAVAGRPYFLYMEGPNVDFNEAGYYRLTFGTPIMNPLLCGAQSSSPVGGNNPPAGASGGQQAGGVSSAPSTQSSAACPACTTACAGGASSGSAPAAPLSCSSCLAQKCPVAPAVCGDGPRVQAEECDDGNKVDNDGCTSACKVEPGYECITGPLQQFAPPSCVEATPVCTQGGAPTCPANYPDLSCLNGAALCTSPTSPGEAGLAACNGGVDVCTRRPGGCGDFIVTSPEICDDGNITNGDGCSGTCAIEESWQCAPVGSCPACANACGSGQAFAPDTQTRSFVAWLWSSIFSANPSTLVAQVSGNSSSPITYATCSGTTPSCSSGRTASCTQYPQCASGNCSLVCSGGSTRCISGSSVLGQAICVLPAMNLSVTLTCSCELNNSAQCKVTVRNGGQTSVQNVGVQVDVIDRDHQIRNHASVSALRSPSHNELLSFENNPTAYRLRWGPGGPLSGGNEVSTNIVLDPGTSLTTQVWSGIQPQMDTTGSPSFTAPSCGQAQQTSQGSSQQASQGASQQIFTGPACGQCFAANCPEASGSVCSPIVTVIHTVCGNRKAEAGEECGEPGLQCGQRLICNQQSCTCAATPAVCGDSSVDSGEECDDGNTTNKDGCSDRCVLEEYQQSSKTVSSTKAVAVLPPEIAKINSSESMMLPAVVPPVVVQKSSSAPASLLFPGPGTTSSAPTGPILDFPVMLPAVSSAQRSVSASSSAGVVNAPPAHEVTFEPINIVPDPSKQNGQTCALPVECLSALCFRGVCGACITDADCGIGRCQNGACQGFCGNGIIEPGEQCDAGGKNDDTDADHCRTDCRRPACGDSVRDAGEQCDDGNRNESDGCNSSCIGNDVRGDFATIDLEAQPRSSARPGPGSAPGGQTVAYDPPRVAPDAGGLGASVTPGTMAQHAPAGRTGPVSVVVMAGGAAAGWAWVRKRRTTKVS